MILSITFLLSPETYLSRDGLAVFIFTPTWLTAFVTTKSKDSSNLFSTTSCWYNPTPILFESTFTNSDNGSCNLLAIDIALLSSTCKFGNSDIASLLAE